MTEQMAKEYIQKQGFNCSKIRFIPEGHNHYVFEVELESGLNAIAKFKKGNLESTPKCDSLFGGLVSIAREKTCSDLLLKHGLTAPKYYFYNENFSLVEKLPGKLWTDYLKEEDYSKQAFLDSIRSLGSVMAKLHTIRFKQFGNIMADSSIACEAKTNFADRIMEIIRYRFKKALSKNIYNQTEQAILSSFFQIKLWNIELDLKQEKVEPVMVITDLHGDNFLVDSKGEFSGFFDLECCQAAHPALEMYGIKLFLFNYFDGDAFSKAEQEFFKTYNQAGGNYNPNLKVNEELEHVLACARIMELTESYFTVKDGIRDSWSARFRKVLFNSIAQDKIDYLAIGNIFRDKTKQPTILNSRIT